MSSAHDLVRNTAACPVDQPRAPLFQRRRGQAISSMSIERSTLRGLASIPDFGGATLRRGSNRVASDGLRFAEPKIPSSRPLLVCCA